MNKNLLFFRTWPSHDIWFQKFIIKENVLIQWPNTAFFKSFRDVCITERQRKWFISVISYIRICRLRCEHNHSLEAVLWCFFNGPFIAWTKAFHLRLLCKEHNTIIFSHLREAYEIWTFRIVQDHHYQNLLTISVKLYEIFYE